MRNANKIDGGYVLLSRRLLDSEIWRKPADWLKIWVYILQEVRFNKGRKCKRGENWFNFRDLARDCQVSYSSVDHCVRWLKSAGQIATRKATRGCFIFVVRYEEYQNSDLYKSESESDTNGDLKAKQKRFESDTIREEGKNDNNGKNKNMGVKKKLAETMSADADSCIVDLLEMEYRKFIPVLSVIFKYKKTFTQEGLKKWKARRKNFSAREIGEAFINLQNEPDLWKIKNNGQRELSWWLKSDDRIREMQNCHLKESSSLKSAVLIS